MLASSFFFFFADILQSSFITDLEMTFTNMAGSRITTTGMMEVILLWFLSSEWIDESHDSVLQWRCELNVYAADK